MAKEISGTREWASHSANATIGCSNNCEYCYSRDNYEKFDTSGEKWTVERSDENEVNKKRTKKSGTIMFPTKHDITIHNYDDCLIVLKNLLKVGNDVLIVSKPSEIVIDRLTNDLSSYKDKILFRFTIGSMDNEILSFWEPNAPYFEDRVLALETAFNKGFSTSISMEPLLDNDLEETKALVAKLEPFVTDSIWIGKMNKPEKRIKIEENEYIREYLSRQSDENIIEIYNFFKNNEKIKWKESIKKIVGIEVPTEKGLDI